MEILKKLTPHIIAIVLFLGLSSVYFSPLFEGYNLKQNDVQQHKGMSKELVDYRVSHDGEEALWTNSMFGGMPAYQISLIHNKNLVYYVDTIIKLGLPRPVAILFWAMLGFYILMLCLKINPWLGIIGSLAYGFSTFNILYIDAGHMSKINAVTYMAPALGGMLMAFRGNKLWGTVIYSFFMALNLTANHLQITYYLLFLLVITAMAEVINLMMKKQFKNLILIVTLLLFGTILSILPSSSNLITTSEYSKHTTRGSTDLTIEPNGKKNTNSKANGLAFDYILEYNYSPGEILSIAIPNAKGGKDDYIGNNEQIMDNMNSEYADQVAQSSQYWGGQRFSGGAIYMGTLMVGLFILGLVFVKDYIRWPLLGLFVLIVFLSGKENFVNGIFLNHFPMYNKFRDSKMILVVLQIIIPLMAVFFIEKLIKKEGLIGNQKTWIIGFGSLVFILLVFYISPSLSGSFIKDAEVKQFSEAIASTKDPNQINAINSIKSDLIDTRIAIFKSDVVRSILFFVIGSLILIGLIFNKINSYLTYGAIGLLVLVDQIPVCKRYLNNEEGDYGYLSYEDKVDQGIPFKVENADIFILNKEKKNIQNFSALSLSLESKMKGYYLYSSISEPEELSQIAEFGTLGLNSDFRVLNFNNPFNESNTSYFHKSIGGYHGAKLKRYQEMIEFYIGSEIGTVNRLISQAKMQKLRGLDSLKIDSQEKAKAIFDTISVSELLMADSTPILNMLNTKYIVIDKSKNPIENKQANGNAWFVSKAIFTSNANEEMKALKGINSRENLVINSKEHSSIIRELNKNKKGKTDKITLTKYATNKLSYTSNSKTELPAVFSEIWYPDGWNCYIDGKKTDKIFRANYILRGALIPAGKHKIEWKFEPESFSSSSTTSMVGSGLLFAFVFGSFGFSYWLSKKQNKIIFQSKSNS